VEWNWEKVPACVACGHQGKQTIYEQTSSSITLCFVKCDACALVYQAPRLTRATSHAYFNSSLFWKENSSEESDPNVTLGYPDYDDWDPCYRETAKLRLQRIQRFCPPPARLLEIGTATGTFLQAAKLAGYDVEGVDVASEAARRASERFGLPIRRGFLEEIALPKAHYDVICVFGGISCWRDPLEGLRRVRASLKPGGFFVLNYPDRDSVVPKLMGRRYFEFNPASFTIFSRTSLGRCLKQAGFLPIFSQTERQIASLGRIFSYLKLRPLEKLAKKLHLTNLRLPVVVPGTVFEICRPHA